MSKEELQAKHEKQQVVLVDWLKEMLAPFDWVEPVQEIVKSPAKEIVSGDKKDQAQEPAAEVVKEASAKKESPAKEEPEVKDKVEEKPAEVIEKVATPVKAEATPEKKESPVKSDAAPFDPKSAEKIPAQASESKEALPENRLTFAPKVEESSPEKSEAPK